MTNTVNMPSGKPSRKVLGATAGAGAGAVTSGLVRWGLDEFVFEPSSPTVCPAPCRRWCCS